MGKASGTYKNEDMRRSAIRPKLLDVISVGMKKIINLNSTSTDGMVVTQALAIGEVAAIGIEEDKDEFGDRGSDPSTQDLLSCCKYMGCVAFAKFYFPGFLIPFGLTSNILSTMNLTRRMHPIGAHKYHPPNFIRPVTQACSLFKLMS